MARTLLYDTTIAAPLPSAATGPLVADAPTSRLVMFAGESWQDVVAKHVARNILKYGFTERETEIVLLLFGKLMVREIAYKLYIELSTLKNQLSAIYRKAGIVGASGHHSRALLIVKLLDIEGLIGDTDGKP